MALEHRIVSYNQYRINISQYDQCNNLKELKKCEGFEWLKETPAQTFQQTLKDLDQSFKNFFRGLKKGEKIGFPKFKKKGKDKDSFRFPQGFSLRVTNKKKAKLKLPKIGEVTIIMPQAIEGRIRNVTVIRDGSSWFACLNCEIKNYKVPENNGEYIGIDLGIKKTVQSSKDHTYELPEKEIKEIEERIKLLQKRGRNKKRFSSNWKKHQLRIRKLHSKISRIRRDFQHKTSCDLTKNHSLIALEELKIKNMSKSAKGTLEKPGKNVAAKSGLNKSILRNGWHELRRQLEYKANWYGSHLIFVDPKFTSQICSTCGHKDKQSRISQSEFVCTNCNLKINADLNASKNILARGLRDLACGENALALSLKQEPFLTN